MTLELKSPDYSELAFSLSLPHGFRQDASSQLLLRAAALLAAIIIIDLPSEVASKTSVKYLFFYKLP